MTTKTEELPITKILEEERIKFANLEPYWFSLIQQVRQLEQEQIAKAKKEEREKVTIELNNLWLQEQEKWRKRHIEEERNECVIVLEELFQTYTKEHYSDFALINIHSALRNAIERISNQP